MSVKPRYMTLIAAAAAAAMVLYAASAWIPRSETSLSPSLSEAVVLAEGHRFDESEAIARSYLQEKPDSSEAHMLLAQLALNRPEPSTSKNDRPDPRPAQLALEHLDRVRPDKPYLAALVKLYRGKAEYRLGRLDDAETSWNEAIRIDPKIPEAGWSLLELHYLEGRVEEARPLALRMHQNEPDPRDRAQYLLELLRQDAQPHAAGSVVQWLEPLLQQNPNDLHAKLAMGRNLVRDGQVDRGLAMLKRIIEDHPSDPDVWDAWLTALDDSGQTDLLIPALDHVPRTFADSPRFAKHQARAAQERADWKAAVMGYRRALTEFPNDQKLKYRLARALRNSGETAEADQLQHEHRAYQVATQEVRDLYEEANADKTLGVNPHSELYQRIADLRERMGLKEEALAWHRMVLTDEPKNVISLAAVPRLQGH